jgi:hypothetical protein
MPKRKTSPIQIVINENNKKHKENEVEEKNKKQEQIKINKKNDVERKQKEQKKTVEINLNTFVENDFTPLSNGDPSLR